VTEEAAAHMRQALREEAEDAVDPDTLEPVYLQLAAAWRRWAIKEAYPRGTPIPSESELAQAHGVSRETVRQALRVLVTVGAIKTKRGVGSFIGKLPPNSCVKVAPGSRITARPPLPGERKKMGTGSFTSPVLVVEEPGRDDRAIYDAACTVIFASEPGSQARAADS
jgi:GntR family transcriptional regulator